MKKNNFKVLRGGIHSTFQDDGYDHAQHLGISTGGVADQDSFKLANKIVNNELNCPVLEFSIQGPHLKLQKGKCRFVITGNVMFNVIQEKKIIKGVPNHSYILNEGDVLDILATIKSNYGYLAVEGGFSIEKYRDCASTLTQSKLGPNRGGKISEGQFINFNLNGSNINSSLKNHLFNFNDNIIRVLKGPQMNYFMQKIIKDFFAKPFIISNMTNRMGIRLEGNSIYSIKSHNIASEGIIKGSIQVPGDGNPIILMADHPSIGGYPKIATVILADIPKLAQLPFNSKIFFNEVSLSDAEKIFKEKTELTKTLFKEIKYY